MANNPLLLFILDLTFFSVQAEILPEREYSYLPLLICFFFSLSNYNKKTVKIYVELLFVLSASKCPVNSLSKEVPVAISLE